MNKRFFMLTLINICCVMLLTSCCHSLGWWLGIPPPILPRQVITNKLGIQKAELPSDLISQISVSKFPKYKYDPYMGKFNYSIFGDKDVCWFKKTEFEFGGSSYYIGYSSYRDKCRIVFVKSNQLKKIVKVIPIPSESPGLGSLDAFTVQLRAKKYLVVVALTLKSSHGSLLYVLDEKLDVVYEEHAPYAFETGTYLDECYGECVIVKRRDDCDKDRAKKYYMYYLPKRE